MHAGMSWQRIEDLGGLQWPCPDEEHPGTLYLHSRLWEFHDPAAYQGAQNFLQTGDYRSLLPINTRLVICPGATATKFRSLCISIWRNIGTSS